MTAIKTLVAQTPEPTQRACDTEQDHEHGASPSTIMITSVRPFTNQSSQFPKSPAFA
jgi:hypothetical protein